MIPWVCDFNVPLLPQWLTEEQLPFRGAAEPEPSPPHPLPWQLISSHLEQGESVKSRGRFGPRALRGGKDRLTRAGMLSFGICVFTAPGTFKMQGKSRAGKPGGSWNGMQPLGLAGDAGERFLEAEFSAGSCSFCETSARAAADTPERSKNV